MEEKLLQYIWQHKLFDITKCYTTSGDKLVILSAGEQNSNSGPDFANVRILIDNTLWVGSVEIHQKSSDWNKHHHQNDEGYNNVILHVVFEHDKEITLANKGYVPTLELKPLIPLKIIETYHSYMYSKDIIVCRNQFINVDTFRLFAWMDRLMMERLEEKTEFVSSLIQLNKQNLEEAFYIFLAYYFGFNINNVPFQLLATSLPLMFLAKQKNNLFQVEAMLFGQAGLLEENFKDEYPQKLKEEYKFIKNKFSLECICRKDMWKFAKTYPSGFPTIRIAQLAMLIHQSSSLLSKIIEVTDVNQIKSMFCVTISEYWQTHYLFDGKKVDKSKNLGESAINTLIINAVLPFMYYIGRIKNDNLLKERAINFYEQLPIEKNSIVNEYTVLRNDFTNAFHSQALIQLKKKYCNKKECLRCGIGLYLLKM